MKLLMENWRQYLNEGFVRGDPSEVYEKIRDWALTYRGPSIEVLGIKQPRGISERTQDVLTHMLNELQEKLDNIEALGGATRVHFKDVTANDLAPFFEFDYKSEDNQEAGNEIKLFYTPNEQKAKIDFSSALDGLPEIDPTTGEVAGSDPAPITPATGMDPSNYSRMGAAGPAEYYEE